MAIEHLELARLVSKVYNKNFEQNVSYGNMIDHSVKTWFGVRMIAQHWKWNCLEGSTLLHGLVGAEIVFHARS